MARSTTTDVYAIATGALDELTPPTTAMLFDGAAAGAIEELDRARASGQLDEAATEAALKKLNDGPPLLPTRGGTSVVGTVADIGSSFLDLMHGVFVPVEGEPSWLPAAQRYVHDEVWRTAQGSGSAYKRNGKLTAIQGVDTTVRTASTSAGVYASFQPHGDRFGKLSRVTIDPDIAWTGRDLIDVNHVWNAQIDGRIWFDYRIWTVVYELNIATGGWDPLPTNASARSISVASASWHIASGGLTGHSGRLHDGAAALSFVVEPQRTYLFGVVAEMRVSHSLRRIDRQPIPQPALSDLSCYALFKADVPAMYMSHVVLAA